MSKYEVYVREAWRERMVIEADDMDAAIEQALKESMFADPEYVEAAELPS